MTLPIQIDAAHGLALLGGEPQVFHCHHYNCFLQKSVLDLSALVPAESLLTRPAAEVAYSQFQRLKSSAEQIEELFRTLGYGLVELGTLGPSGGSVTMRSSHYAMGWLSKFGRSDRAHCYFAAGFVEAAARHLFGGDFTARESSCVAKGDAHCVIEVARGGAPLSSSPGAGSLATFGARPAAATRTPVNEAAIIEACSGLPLAGDREGLVHAFGVSLTRHHANYYNLLCYRFERELERSAGPAALEAARLLFIEAGRVCAFHTFGGVMLSAEWDALIKPQCQTREDWVYGLISVVNAFGWGRWSVAAIEPGARLELVVDGSYESNGYLAMYGASTAPRCYLATGGAAGLMNLIYNADILARPELTPEFYEQTFRNPGFFVGREIECRTMGAPACRFIAERL